MEPRVATLIVNPAAGRARLFAGQKSAILAALTHHGYLPRLLLTDPAPHSAQELAATALDSAMVLACGGDGTVHGVVQALAGTGVPLGVLPLGTANALARNLQLPLDPLAALATLLTYAPQTIPLGRITTAAESRYFVLMAGCGPDGALVRTLAAAAKSRFGRSAYYVHAARLFATSRWPAFQVSYRPAGSADWRSTEAVALLAARVPDLGGAFSTLSRGAALTDTSLRVQLVRAPGHLTLPAWFGLSRLGRWNPWLQTLEVDELRCTALEDKPVWAQADAESLGGLPIGMSLAAAALQLLMPPDDC